MAADPNYHALVIGASGLIGWSVVSELLLPYPAPTPFKKVTALVNRHLEFEDSLWPENSAGKPTLSLVSGVNLLCSDEELETSLKDKVSDVESITHVYYFGRTDATSQNLL
jgi:hypothetical protein